MSEHITLPRATVEQALEALKTSGCVAFTGSACHCNSTCSSYTAAVILRDALALEQQGKIYALEMARSMEQKTAKLKQDALRAELKEATEAINDPAVNNLRTLPESIRVLCAQRDALLEALRTLLSYANVLEMRLVDADGEHRAMQQARAAIKKAEEGK